MPCWLLILVLVFAAVLQGCEELEEAAPRSIALEQLHELQQGRICDANAKVAAAPRWESNAPPLEERHAKDVEIIRSKSPKVLENASLEHQHGRLGLFRDGSCCKLEPLPMPNRGLSKKELLASHRGFSFSSRGSEAVDVDRVQADVRSDFCKARHETYPCHMPKASVVMVFHNEHMPTLLRSVHSVLNLSPAELLEEVLLVDDDSRVESKKFSEHQWRRLQGELEEHLVDLPKVSLIRLRARRGLMRARMEGIWRAKGEVVVCLDSHIETTPGWLEPLLWRITEERTRVVVPSIDGIDTEDFSYEIYGLGLVSFSWLLNQKPRERPEGEDSMAASSVLCGGLFAVDRSWFLHLGGYDPELQIYGGEEMEIGFATWQCGGSVVHEPCSHIGHIWRSQRYWSEQVYEIDVNEVLRNRLRVAEVWMDEYATLVQLASPGLLDGRTTGDVGARKALRDRLGCKTFDWYIDNVATEIYAPRLSPVGAGRGSLRSLNMQACVDTKMQDMVGGHVGASPCKNEYGNQEMELESTGVIRLPLTGFCLGASKDCPKKPPVRPEYRKELPKCHVVLADCRGANVWTWSIPVESRKGIGQLMLQSASLCLELQNHNWVEFDLRLTPCRRNDAEEQLWLWDDLVKSQEL